MLLLTLQKVCIVHTIIRNVAVSVERHYFIQFRPIIVLQNDISMFYYNVNDLMR